MAIARHKKRAELEEVSEEVQNGIKESFAQWEAKIDYYLSECLGSQIKTGRVRVVGTLKTDAASEET